MNSSIDQTDRVRHPLEFTGKGGEYFGIWIVNLFFSVLTLGIYSAWAKVRTNQYFYGHTKIDGHSFRYLATPMQILKGRLIAFAIFLLYSLLSTINPFIALVLFAVFSFVSPWLIVQGLKFNMHMTSYRNVRFSFAGNYVGALVNFVLFPMVFFVFAAMNGAVVAVLENPVFAGFSVLAIFIGAFLYFPWVMKRIDSFIHNHITYGGKKVVLKNKTSEYYKAALIAGLVAIAVSFSAAFIAGAFGLSIEQMVMTNRGDMGVAAAIIGFVVMLAFYWLGFSLVTALYQSRIRNHILRSAEIEEVATFESTMDSMSYANLMVTNSLILIVTLGLGLPFVKIRKAAYLAKVTAVNVDPRASEVIDKISENSNSFGEEAADFFDLDISIT